MISLPLLKWHKVCSGGLSRLAYVRAHGDDTVNSSIRKAKVDDAAEAAETAAANKQARMVEADTFRGVHLDPNAHHWDEVRYRNNSLDITSTKVLIF